jgi:hypothetical protein
MVSVSGGWCCCAAHNPILGWPGPNIGPGPHVTPGGTDHTVMPHSVLATLGSQADLQFLANQTDDVSRSDVDWVELPPEFMATVDAGEENSTAWAGAGVYVVWLAGDQGAGGRLSLTTGVAGVVYNRTERAWLESYFV